jgi:signal recognition particle receptor subunit beta
MAARQGLTREIDCKVVYVGPAGSGKSTTIRALHDRLAPDSRGPVLSPTLPGGGTLFFDLLTIELGTFGGRRIRLQLLSAPGDPGRSEVRRTVLRGADGVIFVSDSTPGRMEANLAALRDLRADLEALGQSVSVPVVFQHNKRDVPGAVPEDELNQAVNPEGAPAFAAVATNQEGVVEPVTAVSGQLVRALA